MLPYSSANRFWLPAVTMPLSVVAALVELNRFPVSPEIWTAPVPPTWYWKTVSPAQNTALPDTEMLVNDALAFALATRSPRWPPQPTLTPSGPRACQVDCWSLCEPSDRGRGTLLAVHCALVIGRDQRPGVAEDGQPTGAEQRRDLRHAGMQAERPGAVLARAEHAGGELRHDRRDAAEARRRAARGAVVGRGARREQRDRVGAGGPHLGVDVERRRVGAQHHVRRVVPAVHEQADDRLVRSGGLGHRGAERRQVERERRGGGADRAGHDRGGAQELAARSVVGRHVGTPSRHFWIR